MSSKKTGEGAAKYDNLHRALSGLTLYCFLIAIIGMTASGLRFWSLSGLINMSAWLIILFVILWAFKYIIIWTWKHWDGISREAHKHKKQSQ